MIRSLRAVAWMRWRLMVNSLRGTGRRGRLQALSRAIEALTPILLFLLMAPTMLALGVLGFAAGWLIATESVGGHRLIVSSRNILSLLRVIPGAMFLMVIVMPVVRSVTGLRENLTRLLLLPISRRLLHVTDLVATIGDPWIAMPLSGIVLLPCGLLAAGAVAPALVASAAGLELTVLLASVGTLMNTVLHLAFRKRRRGELVSLVVAGALSMSGMLFYLALPGDFEDEFASRDTEAPAEAAGTGDTGSGDTLPGGALSGPPVLRVSLPGWMKALPTEPYARAVGTAAAGHPVGALLPLGLLAILATGACTLSSILHRRLIETPAAGGGRRPGERRWTSLREIPGVPRTVSAVAQAQTRLVLRSTRGKMAVWVTPLMMMPFALAIRRVHDIGSLTGGIITEGQFLATLIVPIVALAFQMVMLNQFAVDRAGLAMQLLAPFSDRDIVNGKALSGGILNAATLLMGLIAIMLVAPGGSPFVWAAVFVSGLSLHLTLAPIAALVSMLFPRTSDLTRIGKSGNPHPLASLIGMLATVVGFAPSLVLAAVALYLFDNRPLVLLFALLWLGLVAALSIPLLGLVARLLPSMKETLVMVSEGR